MITSATTLRKDERVRKYTCVAHQDKIFHKQGTCPICHKKLSFIVEYTPVFEANKKAFEAGYPGISNEGSSRSSKTYSEMQLVSVIGLMPEVYGVCQISVVSMSLPHLKRGARKDFLEIANDWEFFREQDFNRTDNIYKFKGGTTVEFFGCEDAEKLRGPGRDILVINEANLITLEEFHQLEMRTTRCIFIDYNPSDEHSWVYGFADDPDNKKIHSTYLSNLAHLTRKQVRSIEKYKDIDENLWKVFGLGLRGTSSETIYTHWKIVDHFPQCDQVVYGLDFGFNHPNVLTKVGLLDDDIYVEELIYESAQTTSVLIDHIKMCGLTNSCEIYCDSARPDTIEEMNRSGLWALESNKSVWDGIQFIKGRKLYITRKSLNLLSEIKTYKWMKDKNNVVLEKPLKFRDDAMDSMRYAIFTKFSQPLIYLADATY